MYAAFEVQCILSSKAHVCTQEKDLRQSPALMTLEFIKLGFSFFFSNQTELFPQRFIRQVKDLPAVLRTKEEVIDVVSRLIWLMSVRHSAVNYPVSDYGAFTPVLPTKVYNDSSVPPGTFSVLNLPNVDISLVSKTNQ